MVEENKNNREDDSINLLLEQALTQQRDEMMENFSHIIQCLSNMNIFSKLHFSTSPFKVYILIFPYLNQIDANALKKWFLLEGYFSIHIFSNKEKIETDIFIKNPLWKNLSFQGTG
jgi:hypothetical protein